MKCKRCGQCCQTMALGVSPKELKTYYLNWRDGVKNKPVGVDIWLIYPMLIYLGYDKKVQRYRYKCKHLVFKGKKAVCSIYEIRPKSLCQEYGDREKFQMGIMGSLNRELYPNCVF